MITEKLFTITFTLFCREMLYVVIYALSGKFFLPQKSASVKYLTNIMSVPFINSYNPHCFAAIDAKWQEWGEWSQCSTPCGQGSQIRARACSEPSFGGSEQCCGNPTETRECSSAECAGKTQIE